MIDNGKRSVLGVLVDVVDCEAATAKVLAAAREHRPFALTALAVHGVMTGVQDKAHNARLNAFDVVTPDGQPVRWALNSLHGAGLAERVYGPTLTLEVLRGCAAEGLPVYLYGSTADTLDRLVPKLIEMFPALKIAGTEASKFRAVRPGLRDAPAHRRSAAGGRRRVRLPRRAVAQAARVDAETRPGVAVAPRPGAGPPVETVSAAQPGIPGPADRAEAQVVEGHPTGSRHRATGDLRRVSYQDPHSFPIMRAPGDARA